MAALLFAFAAGLTDLASGILALRGVADRFQTRYVIAFGAGVLLAATFFDVLPEANVEKYSFALAAGFVSFYLLEKVAMLHACGETECETHEIGPIAVLGMALDNIVDGASITVGNLIDPFLGLVITLAVVLHEIPQGITSAIIMRNAMWPQIRIVSILALAGALYPIGALLADLIPEQLLQLALAFIAGDFIYVGASDLLPEAHRRFNASVILAVLTGMGFVLTLRTLIPTA